MLIDYLVQAHACPSHFGRLTEALSAPNTRLFAHIDAKSYLSPFALATTADVTFVEDRVAVHWADFSQVAASLALMRKALSRDRPADYLVLLSGSDYPLASQADIAARLAAAPDRLYLNALPMPTPTKPLSRLAYRRVRWLDRRPLAHKALARLRRRLPWLLRRDIRAGLGGLTPFAGSSWWALPRAAAAHVLEFCDRRPEVVRFFERSHYADETFFQTVLCNSPFADRIRGALTCADWDAGARNPATLTPAHIDRIRRTGGLSPSDARIQAVTPLFARKFPDDSAELISALPWRAEVARSRTA